VAGKARVIIRDGEAIAPRPGSCAITILLTGIYLGWAAMFGWLVPQADTVPVGLFMLVMSILSFLVAVIAPFMASQRITFQPDRLVNRSAFGTQELSFSEIASEQWLANRGGRSLIVCGSGRRTILLGSLLYNVPTLTAIHDEIAARCRRLGREVAPPLPIPISVKTLHHALSLYLGGMFAAMALIVWLAIHHHA
jgi:hypothetical protein